MRIQRMTANSRFDYPAWFEMLIAKVYNNTQFQSGFLKVSLCLVIIAFGDDRFGFKLYNDFIIYEEIYNITAYANWYLFLKFNAVILEFFRKCVAVLFFPSITTKRVMYFKTASYNEVWQFRVYQTRFHHTATLVDICSIRMHSLIRIALSALRRQHRFDCP